MIARATLSRKFIGREDELAFLLERQRDSARSKGGVVLVTGDAGMGKSRLLREFRSALASRRSRIAESPCLERAQRPFAPILDILATLDPAASEVAAGVSTARERFEALRNAFLRVAERSAFVALIEDAHWADAATLDLLEHLAGRIHGARMLLVVSSREPLLERSNDVDRIVLTRLDSAQSDALIDEASAGREIAPSVRRQIASIAEGSPFYIEELLKSTLEGGNLRVAPTLRASLLERLEALDAPSRDILEHAAVLGVDIDVAMLVATAGASRERVVDTLLAACDRQLLEELGPDRFRFRHALTRLALDSHVPVARRAERHRAALAVLESTVPTAPVELLAHHAWHAREFAKAARYAEAAGDAAGQLFAYDDAATQYDRALEALGASPAGDLAGVLERVRIYERLALTRVSSGSNRLAYDAYLSAAAALERTSLREREAEIRVLAAIQAYRNGDPQPIASLEAMLARLGPQDTIVATLLHVGIAHLHALRYATVAAHQHLERVDPDVVAARPAVLYMDRAARATLAYASGDAVAFEGAVPAWLSAAKEHDGGANVPLVYFNGGMFFAILGMHDRAAETFALALETSRARKDRMGEAAARGMSAMAALYVGDLEAVRLAVRAVFDLATDGKIALAHASAWGTIAALHLGDDALLDECFDPQRIEAFAEPMLASGYARVLISRGRGDEARALLGRAIRFYKSPRGVTLLAVAVARDGSPDDVPLARELLARAAEAPPDGVDASGLRLFDAYLARRSGQGERSRSEARLAADGFARLGYPLLAAEAFEVAGLTDEALALFARHGARGDVTRLAGPNVVGLPARASSAASSLSGREDQIAGLVARGLSNRAIAERCFVSTKTVEKHLASIFRKLEIGSRAELAAFVASRALPDAVP